METLSVQILGTIFTVDKYLPSVILDSLLLLKHVDLHFLSPQRQQSNQSQRWSHL